MYCFSGEFYEIQPILIVMNLLRIRLKTTTAPFELNACMNTCFFVFQVRNGNMVACSAKEVAKKIWKLQGIAQKPECSSPVKLVPAFSQKHEPGEGKFYSIHHGIMLLRQLGHIVITMHMSTEICHI